MEENQKPINNYGNYSTSKGWFNKIKQAINEPKKSSTSYWKILGGVLSALAAIAGVITALIKMGILSVNQ